MSTSSSSMESSGSNSQIDRLVDRTAARQEELATSTSTPASSNNDSNDEPRFAVVNGSCLSNWIVIPSHLIMPRSLTGPANEECPICRCPITDRAVTNSCRHGFDRDCLESFIRQSRTTRPNCPVCRTPFNEINHQIESEVSYQTIPVATLIPPRTGANREEENEGDIRGQLDELNEILGSLRGGRGNAIMAQPPIDARPISRTNSAPSDNPGSPVSSCSCDGQEFSSPPSSNTSTLAIAGSQSVGQRSDFSPSPVENVRPPNTIIFERTSSLVRPVPVQPSALPISAPTPTVDNISEVNRVSTEGMATPQVLNSFRAYRRVESGNTSNVPAVQSVEVPAPSRIPLAIQVQQRQEAATVRQRQRPPTAVRFEAVAPNPRVPRVSPQERRQRRAPTNSRREVPTVRRRRGRVTVPVEPASSPSVPRHQRQSLQRRRPQRFQRRGGRRTQQQQNRRTSNTAASQVVPNHATSPSDDGSVFSPSQIDDTISEYRPSNSPSNLSVISELEPDSQRRNNRLSRRSHNNSRRQQRNTQRRSVRGRHQSARDRRRERRSRRSRRVGAARMPRLSRRRRHQQRRSYRR